MMINVYMHESDVINYILNDLERFQNFSDLELECYREYLYTLDLSSINLSDYADDLFYSTALYTVEEREIYKDDFEGETVLFEYGKYILITR
jgi:hypothetical protein